MIPVYKPYLPKEATKFAHEAIDSTWISSKGKFIHLVESQLEEIHSIGDVRINTATVTNNGTSATHLVARLLHHEYPDIKKLIVPNNVYVAAWNAFLFDKNFELVPVEADEHTWNYDLDVLYESIEANDPRMTGVLVVHNLGNIVNVPKILRDWKGLALVEDNCEGLFGTYENYPSGSLSLASSLSFFGNKNVTSGEGGAVIAQNNHQSYLYKLRSQGQSQDRFIHDELGYNYRMTNVQAAILYGQLDAAEKIMELKRRCFALYKELLADIEEVEFQASEKNTTHSDWMLGIKINGNKNFDELEKFFNSNYVDVRPMFYPINRHKHLKDIRCFGGTAVAEKLNKECVVLPSYPELKDHEIAHVVNTLKQYLVKKC